MGWCTGWLTNFMVVEEEEWTDSSKYISCNWKLQVVGSGVDN